MARTSRPRARRAFTLVEILIVVVILGVLAAIVVPAFGNATTEARRGAFVTELNNLAKAAEMFMVKEGAFLEDASTGTLPTGFDAYVESGQFSAETPLGGRWDTELNDNGFTSAIGVVFDAASDPGETFMGEVDALFDDGDILTGVFQQGNDARRYYYVLEP